MSRSGVVLAECGCDRPELGRPVGYESSRLGLPGWRVAPSKHTDTQHQHQHREQIRHYTSAASRRRHRLPAYS
ncbi:hypothetical protein EDC02_7027 [Micromonospora sp. Llam0]|uniref:hypothetical protein n=1 Tax=Micromonospora sp. Llam0 TaxID=2485143 RepID=UPI000F46114E|nr:hypothetical protein [Micromonospora sp. Llam0]ROO52128.1 hypothetical protein EDC02_7027 [Micromonospora sp. Llam0]